MGDTTPIPYTGDMSAILAPNTGFSGSTNVSSKMCLRSTPVAMVTKILTVNLL